jgi:adenylate cyclase, class 2
MSDMNTEFEAKFLKVSHEEIRKKLQFVGAMLQHPMRHMRRVIIENDELRAKGAFLRVRDEGDKITLTFKQFNDLSVDGAKEYEVVVSDFDKIVALLAAAGLPYKSLQESKRETWSYENAEIVLDEWPWLDPYIEIEADSEEKVIAVARVLGLDWSDAVFGDVMAAYRVQYPHLSERDTVGNLPTVCFGDPLPNLLIDKI